jgi:hypothetical protein
MSLTKVSYSMITGAPVNVLDYGAVGDGVADDTAAIQLALNAAAGRELMFPAGTYLVYALKVLDGCVVNLGPATIKKRPAVLGDQSVATFTGNATVFFAGGFAPVFYLTGDNIVIKDGTVDGNRANDTLNTAATWGGSFAGNANRAGVVGSTNAVASCINVTIDNVHFKNMVGVAIDLDMTGDIRVQNCFEENAKNLFVNISGDATTFLTKGRLWFTGNSCSGDRVQNNVPNPGVLDRKNVLIITDNVIDETLSLVAGGFKTQDSNNTIVSNNTFIKSYLKPQSAPTFVGETYTVTGNTFRTDTPNTHLTGLQMGFHTVKTLSVTGNSLVNGILNIERSSYVVNVSNNAILWTVGPSSQTDVVSGGANNGAAGRAVIANNTVDLGGFNNLTFFRPPDSGGVNVITNNSVMNVDHCWYFQGSSVAATTEYQITNNTFSRCRSLGRINIHASMKSVVIKGNSFLNLDTTTATNYGTISENIVFNFASATYTLDTLSIDGNFWDSSYGAVNFGYPSIQAENGPTITLFVITKNIIAFASPINAWSFGSSAGSMTYTNLYIYDNHFVGDFVMTSGATVTNEYIGNNSSTFFSGGFRTLSNTTKKLIDITGTLTTTIGAAGGASALPATPVGYATVIINGTERKIPYYNA